MFDIALLKIPLLVLGAVMVHAAGSPPTPPPSNEAKAGYSSHRDPFQSRHTVRLTTFVYATVYWANALVESTILLLTYIPSSPGDNLPRSFVDQRHNATKIGFTTPWLVGCCLVLSGATLRLVCYRALGRFFTWELTLQKDHRLITTGPYAIVRHPSYAGGWILCVGGVIMHTGPGGWFYECVGDRILSRTIVFLWGMWNFGVLYAGAGRMRTEDEVLQRQFGEEWEAYALRIPYRIIPFVY